MVQFSQLLLIGLSSLAGIASSAPGLAGDCKECYTATTTIMPRCPPRTKACPPRPMCLRLETVHVPGPNRNCPRTPTHTVSLDCPIPCPTGCGTTTSTITGRQSCPSTRQSFENQASCGRPAVIVPEAPYCPGFGNDCMRLMCIVEKTITVEPSCPTPVTATPSCVRTCHSGCPTTTHVVTPGGGPFFRPTPAPELMDGMSEADM